MTTRLCRAGNKSDLDGARKVTRAEAEAYAKENRLIFYGTTAKRARVIHDDDNV